MALWAFWDTAEVWALSVTALRHAIAAEYGVFAGGAIMLLFWLLIVNGTTFVWSTARGWPNAG